MDVLGIDADDLLLMPEGVDQRRLLDGVGLHERVHERGDEIVSIGLRMRNGEMPFDELRRRRVDDSMLMLVVHREENEIWNTGVYCSNRTREEPREFI